MRTSTLCRLTTSLTVVLSICLYITWRNDQAQGIPSRNLKETEDDFDYVRYNNLSVGNMTTSANQKNLKVRIFDVEPEYTNVPEAIEELVNVYIDQHGVQAVLNSNATGICERQFLIGHYSCRQIGRHIHEYIGELMNAIVRNQTFLWSYCDEFHCGNIENDCALDRMPWIPSAVDVISRLNSNNCSDKAQRLSDANVLDRGVMLPPLVNSDSAVIQSHLQTMNMYGPEANSGALFRAAFRFSNSIISSNEEILKSSSVIGGMGRDRALIIGIHARRSGDIVEKNFIKYVEEKDCIKHILRKSRSKFGERYCILVVSTDRNHTLAGLSTFANSIGCEVMVAKDRQNRPKDKAIPDEDDAFPMIADLNLLAQSDYFIGSTMQGGVRTFFSLLVADLVALAQRGADNIQWLPDDSCKLDMTELHLFNSSFTTDSLLPSHVSCPKKTMDYAHRCVKGGKNREVFFVENCTKHAIPNWDTFLSLKVPVSSIVLLPDDEMNAIETGSPLQSIN